MFTLANRTYVLCFEQSYTAAALMEWIEAGKEPEISIRNAKKGVERSVVLTIKDKDGIYLSLIQRIAFVTSARIHVKSGFYEI